MTPEEAIDAFKLLTDPDAQKTAREEHLVALEMLDIFSKALSLLDTAHWLYNKEWEHALVPVYLPKGATRALKILDEAKTETLSSERCDACKAKPQCLLLSRNPSEILLTSLLKEGYTKAMIEKTSR